MSDDELADSLANLSVVDRVKAKHKKELKELEAKSTKLRHSVPKGDKKRLKEVKDEIAKLEADLKARQDAELKAAEMNNGSKIAPEKPVEKEAPAPKEVPASEPAPSGEEKSHQSRAQRRRDKKAAASAVHAANAAALTENSADSLREDERSKLAAKLEPLSLAIHDVAPNGDCLFGAIMHQLELVHGISTTVPALRMQAADTMRQNIDDYLPFMETATDDVGFLMYCRNIEATHEWGGQLELKAISRALNMPIRVIQSDGADVELTPPSGQNSQSLIITYHRHEFGLGEHYNSTEPWENVK